MDKRMVGWPGETPAWHPGAKLQRPRCCSIRLWKGPNFKPDSGRSIESRKSFCFLVSLLIPRRSVWSSFTVGLFQAGTDCCTTPPSVKHPNPVSVSPAHAEAQRISGSVGAALPVASNHIRLFLLWFQPVMVYHSPFINDATCKTPLCAVQCFIVLKCLSRLE